MVSHTKILGGAVGLTLGKRGLQFTRKYDKKGRAVCIRSWWATSDYQKGSGKEAFIAAWDKAHTDCGLGKGNLASAYKGSPKVRKWTGRAIVKGYKTTST